MIAPRLRQVEMLAQVLGKLGVSLGKPEGMKEGMTGAVLGLVYESACEMSLLGDTEGMGMIIKFIMISINSL